MLSNINSLLRDLLFMKIHNKKHKPKNEAL